MPFAQGSIGLAPMLAYTPGLLIAVVAIGMGLLAIYAVWWLIFKMGK